MFSYRLLAISYFQKMTHIIRNRQRSSKLAVIFDLDGLVLDTEKIAKDSWIKAVNDFGYSITESLYLQMIGRTLGDIEDMFLQFYSSGFPFDQVRTRSYFYIDQQYKQKGISTKPGLQNLLAFIKTNEIEKAIASSSSRAMINKKLKRAKITDLFNMIVSGEDVAFGKPAPDIFIEASRILNIDPKNCVVLEDSPVGIMAAKRAQMVSIWVPDLVRLNFDDFMNPDYTVASLFEVPEILNSLIEQREM